MEINRRIKFLRKNLLHISQKDFSSAIGLKPNTISDIETGKSVITNLTIKVICYEYNVSRDWLLYGTGEIFISKDTSLSTPDFISDFYLLSDEGQKEVSKYITAIIAAKKKEEEV